MNRLHAALPMIAKKTVWNLKYAALGYSLTRTSLQTINYLAARLPTSSFLLDLGCGDGSLLRGLREAKWNGYYYGVDISRAAIEIARQFPDRNSCYQVSDIEAFRSEKKWDVATMIESLYYVKRQNVPALLLRVTKMLNEHGYLLIRIHDVERHRNYVETMELTFPSVTRVSETLFRVDS